MSHPVLYSYSFEHSSSPVICKKQNPTVGVHCSATEPTSLHVSISAFGLSLTSQWDCRCFRGGLAPWVPLLFTFWFSICGCIFNVHYNCLFICIRSSSLFYSSTNKQVNAYALAFLAPSPCPSQLTLPFPISVAWLWFPASLIFLLLLLFLNTVLTKVFTKASSKLLVLIGSHALWVLDKIDRLFLLNNIFSWPLGPLILFLSLPVLYQLLVGFNACFCPLIELITLGSFLRMNFLLNRLTYSSTHLSPLNTQGIPEAQAPGPIHFTSLFVPLTLELWPYPLTGMLQGFPEG